ncbi:uncharacterized protein [Narcine bancroftii]|uniref:uncharacterized protein n=1 Tax=Narcine bancroftii TaxID=1343680 RepID=UPI0038319BD3
MASNVKKFKPQFQKKLPYKSVEELRPTCIAEFMESLLGVSKPQRTPACSSLTPALILHLQDGTGTSGKSPLQHKPVLIKRSAVEWVSSWVSEPLKIHPAKIMKESCQLFYFMRSLRRLGTSPKTLANFYRYTVESILTGCITAWYSDANAQDGNRLQRVVNSASAIMDISLHSIKEPLSRKQPLSSITMPLSHCSHQEGGTGGQKTPTEQYKNRFFLSAFGFLNEQ